MREGLFIQDSQGVEWPSINRKSDYPIVWDYAFYVLWPSFDWNPKHISSPKTSALSLYSSNGLISRCDAPDITAQIDTNFFLIVAPLNEVCDEHHEAWTQFQYS